ncbi:hypothetical protein ACJIZ3_010147 [Penstemon smallii]|uniref:DCD domain-containing protein n=1 Tax=Penstemon smallii TaxID=265156 RepID=A0ABD3TFL8_9LAMI
MTKGRGRKLKRKGKCIGQSNAKIKRVKVPKTMPEEAIFPADPVASLSDSASPLAAPVASLANPAESSTSDPAVYNNSIASNGVEKENGIHKRLPGFIFMCNSSTKLQCYQYRVFGLPKGKKEVVEAIKPGSKLFLFDFEVKRLYGIYEATSAGKLNLERAAFGGKFPAQVKFRISKECLPLPESSLRHVIRENYKGSKFKQELSGKQVKKLSSSFRPLIASSSQLAPQAPPNVSLFQAMPPPSMQNHFKHTVRVPHSTYGHAAPVNPPYVPNVHFTQQGYRAAGINSVAYSQQPRYTGGVAHGVQEPYPRYRTIEGGAALHNQVTNLGMQYHQLQPVQREQQYKDNVVSYNFYQQAPPPYTSSVMQPQLPTPGIPQESAITSSYNPYASTNFPQYKSSLVQPQLLAHGIPQESAVTSSYYPYASTNLPPYTSSVVQQQFPPAGKSQESVITSSYYPYARDPGN